MAKKRKSRASQQPEPQPQPEPVQEQVKVEEQEQSQPEVDPEPESTNQVAQEEKEQVLVKKEVGEGPGEQPEQMEVEDLNGNGAEKGKGNCSDDAVPARTANGGEEEEDLEEEPLEKVLEPFSKDQLMLIVQEAVTKHRDFMENVTAWADKDPSHRKIFVHGLGWDATAETLTNVFGKYGEIEDCKAVTDKVSGKSKGYAFILFKHRSGARKALKEPQKKIGNRMASCQLASSGPGPGPGSAPPPNTPPVSEYTQRKIFVSNVSANFDPQKLFAFFSKYGEIEEGPLGLDKLSGKPKGFCLFVYKTAEGAMKALEEPHKIFEGQPLNCSKAIDGPKQNKNFRQPQAQHQHHHKQQQYYQHTAKKGKYSAGGVGSATTSTGHLIRPPPGPAPVGFNPAVAPVLGQALTALLATQGGGFGIGNFLGGLGPVNPQGVPPGMNNSTGYGAQGAAAGYGIQPGMQGGYQNPQMGHGGVRPQGGAPYMGRGR
ncbi:PREDICTED: UBP1-associated protein 2B-like [Ipomoea nil]|uniref:UBP1-associated protein 2B-like n=1 Tax=Ipomoea nil TaxID=35883 RepID=UPI000901D98F|nr:PREDICTED: UBP1-associated protein 2B-like [Ipomoea nil]